MHRRHFLQTCVATTLFPLAACVAVLPEADILRESNAAKRALGAMRRENGAKPLATDNALETAAARQAAYMATSGAMRHDTAPGRGFVQRMKSVNTGGTAAENVAHGRFDTETVLDVWMNSPPHRRNMLDPRFSRFGLAAARDPKDSSRLYWAMVLGS